jgi:hypothetical protein
MAAARYAQPSRQHDAIRDVLAGNAPAWPPSPHTLSETLSPRWSTRLVYPSLKLPCCRRSIPVEIELAQTLIASAANSGEESAANAGLRVRGQPPESISEGIFGSTSRIAPSDPILGQDLRLARITP